MTQTTIDITEAIAVLEAAKQEVIELACQYHPSLCHDGVIRSVIAVLVEMNRAIAKLNTQLAGRI